MVRSAICQITAWSLLAACGPVTAETTEGTTQSSTEGDTDPAPTGGTPSGTSGTTSTSGDDATGSSVTGTSATPTSSTDSTGAVSASSSSTATTSGTTSGTTTTDTTPSDPSTTGTDTGTDTSSDTGAPVPCQTPTDCQPIFLSLADDKPSDVESGWLLCNDESVYYREEAVDCVFEDFYPPCEGQPGDCSVDADCPGNQACRNQYGDCSCTKQCMSDSECEDGEICLCASAGPGWLAVFNTCVPADCTTNADCTGECGCRGSQFFCGTIDSAFCPTVADECSDDDDCGGGDHYCAWNHDETRWTCEQFGTCE